MVNMPRFTTMLLVGMTFSTGLLLGMVLHLPGAHSPDSPRALQQQAIHVNRLKRSLLQTKYKDSEANATAQDMSTSTKGNSHSVTNTKNPEVKATDSDFTNDNLNDKLHRSSRLDEAELDSVHKDGLSQPISQIKYARGNMLQSQTKAGVGIRFGMKGVLQQHETESVNIETSSREQVSGSLHKQSGTGSMGNNKGSDLTLQTDNEIEIDLKNGLSKDSMSKLNGLSDKKEDMASIGIPNVVDGVLWSSGAELIYPSGYQNNHIQKWRETVEGAKVVDMKEGCGRMQNRLLTFSDGTKACARYRLNTDQMQGEVYSYILAQLLGINNVLPSVLQKADPKSAMWSSVDLDLVSAQWHPSKVVILTPWLEDLTPAYIPVQMREKDSRHLHPQNDKLSEMTPGDVSELMQWSDLIIFDYLTANLDRVVNNMFNLQWNSGMMESPAHNLEKSTNSGHLVFLDNESGLFHSYRLLQKYSEYHEDLLRSMCVFRKQTVEAISELHHTRDIGVRIKDTFEQQEPLWRQLPRIQQQNLNILQSRIDNVYQQIKHCQSLFPTR